MRCPTVDFVRVVRALIAITIAVVGVATSSSAAPTVATPQGYTRFTLGGPEHEFTDLQPLGTGWLLVGDLAGPSGAQPVIVATDANGATLWQTPLERGHALAATVAANGTIWVATVAAASPSAPATPTVAPTTPTTPSTEPTPVPSAPLDPDGIGTVAELDPGRVGSVITMHRLAADGRLLSSIDAPLTGYVGQPTAVQAWKDGVAVVGTAISPTGGVVGFVLPITEAAPGAPVFLGESATLFTSAAVAGSGALLIAGASADTLLGKARLGTQDAIVATFTGTKFTKVIRSGGGSRVWASISANPAGGYSAAGAALVSGRREAVISTFRSTGGAIWSKRYPGTIAATEQRVARFGGSLRLVLTASIASSTLYPGWTAKGASDVLVLTLDPNTGTTRKVTALAGPGREEMVDAAGAAAGAVLLRSDGSLPNASGSGPVVLARLSAR